jgi:hypothetical protein
MRRLRLTHLDLISSPPSQKTNIGRAAFGAKGEVVQEWLAIINMSKKSKG